MNETNVSELLNLIPKNQITRVFNQEMIDIDFEFIGFIDQYKFLSILIPKHFTVIDFGCAYNPQCFYFQDHKKYIAVDIDTMEKFKSKNCEIFEMRISDFIKNHLSDMNLNETFAICNYVPCTTEENKMIRENFKNCFIYYPHGGLSPIVTYKHF